MESAGPKQFENSRIYLQWLNFRGAWPMKLDKKAMPWVWVTAICMAVLVTAVFFNAEFGFGPAEFLFQLGLALAGLFAFVLPLIFMLVDLLIHVPRAVHDDTTSTMLQSIMVTPVTTRSILRDLIAWAFRLNLGHILPCLLVFASFFIYPIVDGLHSGTFEPVISDFIMTFFLIMISVAAFWHFLLITGLASAVYPRWVWSTGSTLFFWVIPVLTGVIWATDLIRDELRRLIIERYNPSILGWRVRELDLWEIIIIAVIILEIPTMLLAWYLPRLMSRRRSGEWR